MNTQKKIMWAASVMAIGGLLAELLVFIKVIPYYLTSSVSTITGFFKTVNLSLFNAHILWYHNFHTSLTCNYLNAAFYFLMTLSVVLYSLSKGKETRLLRFSFAVMLLCNVIFCVNSLLGVFSQSFIFTSQLVFSRFLWIVYTIKTAGVAYLCWWALRQFEQVSVLEQVTEREQLVFVKASKIKRAFNLGIDTITCMLVLSVYTSVYGLETWQKLDSGMGRQVTLFVLLIVFRLIYYPFFETLFGTTPAKFLTETRVVTLQGHKLTFTHSLTRTISRFVPFETFSFIVDDGWHDRWTMTQVVKEQRKGVSGAWYFCVFPAMLLIGAGTYLGYEKYTEYQYYQEAKLDYGQKIQLMEKELVNLSTSHYIELEEAEAYSFKTVYLKIEDIDKEKLVATVIPIEDNDVTIVGVDKYYQQYGLMLDKITLNKSGILNGITKDYEQYQSGKINKLILPGYEKEYKVVTVTRQFAPLLKDSGGGYVHQGSLQIYLENCGWDANITSIRNLEGGLQWITSLPYSIDGMKAKQYSCSDFALSASKYERDTPYKFEFDVEDALGAIHTYQVEGVNLNHEMVKLK